MRHSHKEWIAAIFAVLGAALSGYGATTLFAKVADGEYAPSVGIAVFLASVYLMLRGVDAITQDRLATEKEAYFRTLPFLQANSWGAPRTEQNATTAFQTRRLILIAANS